MKKRLPFHSRLDPEVHAGMKERADALGESMNTLINSILADWLFEDRITVTVIKRRIVPDGESRYEFHFPTSFGEPENGEGLAD